MTESKRVSSKEVLDEVLAVKKLLVDNQHNCTKQTEITYLIDDMKQVRETLYGNGKEGLVTIVSKLVGTWTWLNVVITAVIGLVVTYVFNLLIK